MTKDVHALLKFGAHEHMEQLLKEGALYMQPISYFIALEADPWRGDKHEALTEYHQGPGTSIVIDGKHELSHEKGLKFISIRHEEETNCNLFCLIAITPTYREVDVRNDNLGDACVFIHKPGIFLERFRTAALAAHPTMAWGPVEYVPRATYSGPMGPFRKFAEGYEHQNEVRCLVRPGSSNSVVLKLGSLQDIAELGPRDAVNDILKQTLGK